MSTLKVSEIRNASSATGGLSIAADGVVSGALPYPNRNLLYNGAMQVAQRGTSTAGITAAGYYTADRWYFNEANTTGTWTNDIQADAPTGSGLRNSFRVVQQSANTSLDASDFLAIDQRLEGQDLQRIAKGTASAQKLTLSFWVKSNVTGTYIVELADQDNTRQVSAAYTISASATWEKKTITFPADTTGALDNDNAISLLVRFMLTAGSTYTSGTLQTTWASTVQANRYVGQTDLSATLNNYWQITGVQLEVGDTATDFEFKSYGQELAECQRYFETRTSAGFAGGFVSKTSGAGGGGGSIFVPFLCEKRAAPTVNSATVRNANTSATATVSATSISTYGCHYSTGGVTGSIGDAMHLSGTVLTIDAEL